MGTRVAVGQVPHWETDLVLVVAKGRTMLLRVMQILAIGLSLTAVVTLTPSQAANAISGLPAGFTSDLFIGGLNLPTAIAFAPNGKVLIAQKDGHVRVW